MACVGERSDSSCVYLLAPAAQAAANTEDIAMAHRHPRTALFPRLAIISLATTAFLACHPVEQALEPEPTMPDTPATTNPSTDDSMLAIEGQVTYRQRIALRPDATLRIQLLDVSRQDAEAEAVSKMDWPTNGRQVPIPFSLSYDGSRIVQGHRYALRATLLVGDEVLFRTTDSVPVIANGVTQGIEVNLVAAEPSEPKADLQGTRWSLVGVTAGEGFDLDQIEGDKPHITFDKRGRAAGGSGVNRFTAAYESDDEGKLRFTGPIAMTQMAGPPLRMLLEQSFTAALTGIDRYAIQGRTLRLYEAGVEVMRFESSEP